MPYPSIDAGLAAEVRAATGVDVDDPVEVVVQRMRAWLPAGSTAKWLAVDDGRVPPGADPRTGLEARLGGSDESWSCWVLCTGIGALLADAGHDVRVAVEHHRRTDVVDFHSVLIVDDALVDPYLGPSAPVRPGHDVARPDAWAEWVPGERPDHLGLRGGGGTFRYRMLGDRLDRRDVEAFCSVSVTHSGVGRRRYAHWLVGDRLWFVREGDDGTAELRVTEGDSPFEQRRRLVDTGPYDVLRRRIDGPLLVDVPA
ncbi:MAG TPA: hypothetical protein VFU14_03040 [Acidimicrobiales bacterium]|nr:hypothetical protein [Acidimicrobiales bacterium]